MKKNSIVKKMTKKQKDIKRILEATKETELTLKTVDVLMSNMRIPVEISQPIKDILFSQENLAELRSKIENMYDEIFTAKEISELANFYESSTGNKFINNLDGMLEKSASIGKEWGAKIYYGSEKEINKVINNYIAKRNNIPVEYLEKQMEEDEKNKEFVASKLDVIKEYIKGKGWDASKLTTEQSVEIIRFINNNNDND